MIVLAHIKNKKNNKTKMPTAVKTSSLCKKHKQKIKELHADATMPNHNKNPLLVLLMTL